ncbi:MAG: agmatinase [Geminicoccaceae bacterium]|nr:MAG: agmatinase [Geminicoccaceae bacterium]
MAPRDRYAPVDAAVVPRFADVATFLRTVRAEPAADIDIGFVGVPFDLGLNYRTGPREAPAAVREASRVIRRVHPTSGVCPYDLCAVADLGDAPVNPMDKDASLAGIEAFFARLRDLAIRPIAIGGDHTIPTPILRALAKDRAVGILQIDSHPDTLDQLCGTKVNHATFMRRGLEEGLIDPARTVQIGLRGSRFSADDLSYGVEAGCTVITYDDYEAMGRTAAIEAIGRVLGDGPVYVTLDVDGIDPAFCPGTAVPEIGGFTPRDVQVILRSLAGKDIVGADVSEVAPCYDPTGITALTAANMLFELLCVTALAVDRNR